MKHAITLHELKVECGIVYERIEQLTLNHTINAHGILELRLLLPDHMELRSLSGILSPKTSIKLWNTKTADIYFQGILTEYQQIFSQNNHYLELKVQTFSCIQDRKKHCRSYQDTAMTYDELLFTVCGRMSYIEMVEIGMPIARWMLQYEMTDWDFLKEIAYRLNEILVVDETADIFQFWIGMPKRNNVDGITINYRLQREMNQLDACGKPRQSQVCFFSHMESYRIGDYLTIDQRDYLITWKKGELKQGELLFSYKSQPINEISDHSFLPANYAGLSLSGNVLAIKNNMIKLHLAIDREQLAEKAVWFPYAPEGSNVFYYMPEPGSTVNLMIPDQGIEEAIGIYAVRTAPTTMEESQWMATPETKLISNCERKEISLEPGQLLVSGKEQLLYLRLHDSGGIKIESDSSIELNAGTSCQFTNASALSITAEHSITLQARNSSSLYINHDVQLRSDSIYVKGQDAAALPQKAGVTATARMPEHVTPLDAAKVVSDLIGTVPIQTDANSDDSALTGMICTVPIQGNAVAGSGYSGQAAIPVGNELKEDRPPDHFNKVKNQSEPVIDPIKRMEGSNRKLAEQSNRFFQKQVSQKHWEWIKTPSDHQLKNYIRTPHCANRMFTFDPVDVVTGELIYHKTDFKVLGDFWFEWNWQWSSHRQQAGLLGYGIFHPLEMRIQVLKDYHQLLVINEQGRGLIFPFLIDGQRYFHHAEGCSLSYNGHHLIFHCLETGFQYRFLVQAEAASYHLDGIRAGTSGWISLLYNQHKQLSQITGFRGGTLVLAYHKSGLLEQVSLQTESAAECLAAYAYSADHNLLSVTEQNGDVTKFKYQQHLMTQRTDPDKNSFYWHYNQTGGLAKVTKTWSDSGVLSGELIYLENQNTTEVVTKEGHSYQITYNEMRLITDIHIKNGGSYHFSYNEHQQLTAFLNQQNQRYQFTYHPFGMLEKIEKPDRESIVYEYDNDAKLIGVNIKNQDTFSFTYNSLGRIKTIAGNDRKLSVSYHQNGRITAIEDNQETYLALSYNANGDIVELKDQNGTSYYWNYDLKGRCIRHQYAEQYTVSYQYDRNNRIIREEITGQNQQPLCRYQYGQASDISKLDCDGHTIYFKEQKKHIGNDLCVNEWWDELQLMGLLHFFEQWKCHGLLSALLDWIKLLNGTNTFWNPRNEPTGLLQTLGQKQQLNTVTLPSLGILNKETFVLCTEPILLTGACTRPKLFETSMTAIAVNMSLHP